MLFIYRQKLYISFVCTFVVFSRQPSAVKSGQASKLYLCLYCCMQFVSLKVIV